MEIEIKTQKPVRPIGIVEFANYLSLTSVCAGVIYVSTFLVLSFIL